MVEWVKVKRQKRGAAPAPLPDETLSESSFDSAAEEEEIATELRRNNPADKIASLNNIIHRQNITILELRRKIQRMGTSKPQLNNRPSPQHQRRTL
ncbi:unnamed protein product [Hermetia illucens]|uniref:Uncharacterized protein n=1 Tax=Hermetia illucens TaxID=343691 RepID=A0A7R8UUJ5_HERIL|nr:unnamed protein product [Hermetia illucens]